MTVTASPEVGVWSMYMDLHEDDRAAVDAFRSVGVELTTALVNSGVLSPRESRTYSLHGSTDESHRLLDPMRTVQRAAEHESAHAVVGVALGVRLREMRIEEDGSGWTGFDDAPPAMLAVISAAGDAWIRGHRCAEFPSDTAGGCGSDFRDVVRHAGGIQGEHEARRQAWQLLAERRNMVLALGQNLLRCRRLLF
ncbi:hypothetical protein [Protofrankia symbiont of Coriaria ruscifolia]|uniref:Uncharacterized protein n=1 Tax=Candidatus Protofrankia californiensis TaxID=1839754 RepID=A0A1C3NV99_9ACTN|nr:hypothetical protein [Protofrankia symbiont of Coriaria ruscifolia]SBW19356.1 hypothetical protein FDG2_1270 [Candidatus Protofrankia californiensis]